MKFIIEDPIDQSPVELIGKPEDYFGQSAIRIFFPEMDSFLIVHSNGEWQVVDETDINPNLINAITKQLKSHSRYN